jgi:predicted RecB family nuclease
MTSLQIKITSDIFEAELKCPMKCWLRNAGEPFSGVAYTQWRQTKNLSYCGTATGLLASQSSSDEFALSPSIRDFESAKWSKASSVSVQAKTDKYMLESKLHATERMSSTTKSNLDDFIPIRFVFTNKLSVHDKLMLGFDAFVLAKFIGRGIKVGKIIHGDDSNTKRVSVAAFTSTIQQHIESITALLSNPNPPELVLIRHCTECEFRNRCRHMAKETDDLSLLSGMSEKERSKHRNKGIFTVNQLSYIFRPRRTPKRAKNPAKPHYFSLQALAIRERCIYIHGSPILPECKSKVYLDIEGLPDRDFHYLIGVLIVTEEDEIFHSFWADTESEMPRIFGQFAETISQLPDYRVFHYGDYDAAAIRHVVAALPKSVREQFDVILHKSVNVLSHIYPHVYFPTYSNSLKDIAPFLGCSKTSQEATGLDSIIWRMQWECERDPQLKTQLIEYNKADCIALKHVTEFIHNQINGLKEIESGIKINRTDEMLVARAHWQIFAPKPNALTEFKQVIKSAYFDYQREKVFIRTDPKFKSINKRATKKINLPSKPDKKILVEIKNCPHCKSRKLKQGSEHSRILIDLRFSKTVVKKCVMQIFSWSYTCEKCGKTFCSENLFPHPSTYGHGFVSWCIYQHIVLGVNMLKVRKGLVDLFGLQVNHNALHRTKEQTARFYEATYKQILDSILTSPVLHIDETTVNLRKVQGYVWVLSTMDQVYYFYRPTRETDFLQTMLASFNGILISDFYTGYDALPCKQQKCLIHLIRDIDDDLMSNPFDQELKGLAQAFGSLIRSIISTVDRFGLRTRNLKKHKKEVERFMEYKVSDEFTSELAIKYAKRFRKYGSRMFTFLDHDGVPWNNNNAEHAIKRIAKHRRDANGRYTESTLTEYLIIASVLETCEFNNINVLKFLLSKKQTIEGLMRMAGRKTHHQKHSEIEDTVKTAPVIP